MNMSDHPGRLRLSNLAKPHGRHSKTFLLQGSEGRALNRYDRRGSSWPSSLFLGFQPRSGRLPIRRSISSMATFHSAGAGCGSRNANWFDLEPAALRMVRVMPLEQQMADDGKLSGRSWSPTQPGARPEQSSKLVSPWHMPNTTLIWAGRLKW